MKITVYGSKGSIPFFSRSSLTFGGNTACVKVEGEEDAPPLLIDCGSGLLQFLAEQRQAISSGQHLQLDILLSHLHFDHIIGLTGFSPLWQNGHRIDIYTQSRASTPLKEQVFGIFKPPYWPVNLCQMATATLKPVDTAPFTTQNGMLVHPFASMHPDGTTAFKIQADKTFVYLLDCEINQNSSRYQALVEFCRDADAILFDASYLPEDYAKKKGWGHSTYQQGLEFAQLTHCKKMIFSHFCQEYTDTVLNNIQKTLADDTVQHHVAYDGMELYL